MADPCTEWPWPCRGHRVAWAQVVGLGLRPPVRFPMGAWHLWPQQGLPGLAIPRGRWGHCGQQWCRQGVCTPLAGSEALRSLNDVFPLDTNSLPPCVALTS